ncbi:MAG: hypothetical protein WDM90_18925 [Ferruginibacter sp.]
MTYVLFILGIGLLYFVGRRKFNRRNFVGLEAYKTYEHAVANRVLNTVLKILAFFLIVGGIGNCIGNMMSEVKAYKEIQNQEKLKQKKKR